MFRWYENAEVCYAYLPDVNIENSERRRYENLRRSQWFKRGWTLQELLAPEDVQFFGCSWISIGSKRTLALEVSSITGIKQEHLVNFKIANVAQRMSWASKRKTTRVEDEAYCLMGIFGVHMPLLYGEGENAFIRLQLEIMKSSDDDSLFAWEDLHAKTYGLLAPSPTSFKYSADVIRVQSDSLRSLPYAMTNKGLEIGFYILPVEPLNRTTSYWSGRIAQRVQVGIFEGMHLACLHCCRERELDSLILLPLLGTEDREQPFSRVPLYPLLSETYKTGNKNADYIFLGKGQDMFVHEVIRVMQPQIASRTRQPFIFWVDYSSVVRAGYSIRSRNGSWSGEGEKISIKPGKSVVRLQGVGDSTVLQFCDGGGRFGLLIRVYPGGEGKPNIGLFEGPDDVYDLSGRSATLEKGELIGPMEEKRKFLKSGRAVVFRMDKKVPSSTRPRFLIKLEVEDAIVI